MAGKQQGPPRPPRPQGEQKPQGRRQQWEYLELSVNYVDEVWVDSAGRRGTFVDVLAASGAKWFSSALLLNGYGKEGWELAGTVGASGGNVTNFFLKRPVASRAPSSGRGSGR